MPVRQAITVFGIAVLVSNVVLGLAAQQGMINFALGSLVNLMLFIAAGYQVAKEHSQIPAMIAAAGVATVDATLGSALLAVIGPGRFSAEDVWALPLGVLLWAVSGAGCGSVGSFIARISGRMSAQA